jgi:steroid delta-isomerase
MLAMAVMLAGLSATAMAQTNVESDKAAITERLQRWAAAFNARDTAGICDLFAADLAYTVPEVADGNRNRLCSHLDTLLATPGLQLHYGKPDIREIIVSGDIAIVRLAWTLTARKGAARDTGTEPGMDIFKRQPDGRWSIVRFIAFSTTPNKVLE